MPHSSTQRCIPWGFAIVIIKSPAIFQNSFDALSSFGYDYVLTAVASPVTIEEKVVISSTDHIDAPASESFEIGAYTWRLDVAPRDGWRISSQQVLFSLAGFMFVILCLVLVGMLLMADSHPKRLHDLVETDHLTGILNRTGLANRVEELFVGQSEGSATEVILDIDDFKLINDLHGHTVGDEFTIFLPGLSAEEAEGPYQAGFRHGSDLHRVGRRKLHVHDIHWLRGPSRVGRIEV